MGMTAAQSELGHVFAPPRASVESELGGGDGEEEDRETAASAADMATLVEPSFDENILRALCETDVSAPLVSPSAVVADFRCGWAHCLVGALPSAECPCS